MATEEEIRLIITGLGRIHPVRFMRRLNATDAGIGAMLCYLDETDEVVTAGMISNCLNVSTARVAALLKKMEARDLICRCSDERDARVTVVKLSDHGAETVRGMRAALEQQVALLIDRLGMEKLNAYISLTEEIQSMLEPPDAPFRKSDLQETKE